MRILVTGGAGFIGGNLVKRLASMDAGDVLVLDNLQRGYSRDSLPAKAEFRRVDIHGPPLSLKLFAPAKSCSIWARNRM
jgi:nucleoside-diphosphate-sugar epimerase